VNTDESAHLRNEGHATSENRSPDELNRNGNAIRGVIRSVLGGGVENVEEEDTNGDSPLV